MKLESVKSEAEGAALRRQIQSSVRLVEEAIRDTRSLTFQLSPPVLHEIGLTAAIEWLAEHLGEQHGMKILVTRKSAREPAAMAVRVILFQAVRELAFNAIKHAQATAIAIDIRTVRGHLAIKVKDDGAGFDVGTQRGGTRNGMGLFNIRERVQLIGGSMTIESQPGKGTWVMLVAPLEELPAEDGKGLGHEHPHRAM
jgi:signal transduction histidine kinase